MTTPAIRCRWVADHLTVPPFACQWAVENVYASTTVAPSSFWLVFGCVWICSFVCAYMWTHKRVDVVSTGRSDSLLYGEVKECVVWRGIHQAVPPSAKSTFCLTLLCCLPPTALTLHSWSYTLLSLDCGCTCLRASVTSNSAGSEYIANPAVRRTVVPSLLPVA